MINGLLTLSTLVSVVLSPWPLTLCLALVSSLVEPLVPLAVGLLADTLYFAPHSGAIPLYTVYGGLTTALALFVHSRLRADSIPQ